MQIQHDLIQINDVIYKHVYCPNYFITVDGYKYVDALITLEDTVVIAATEEEITPSKDKGLPAYINHLLASGLYTTILLVGTSRDHLLYINEAVKSVLLQLTNIDTISFFFRDAEEIKRQAVEQITEAVDTSLQEKYYTIHQTELNETKQTLQSDYNNKITTLDTTLQSDYNTKMNTMSSDYNTKIDDLNTNLTSSIGNEVIIRGNTDIDIFSAIDTVDGKVTNLSTTVTNNYNSLDSRITTNTNNIATNASNISTLSGNITTINNSLANKVSYDDLGDMGGIKQPDYSKGIGWSGSYTCPNDGWSFILISGYDSRHWAYVNGGVVGVSCGYSGGKEVCNGVFVPVLKNDSITGSGISGTFYPYKE